MSLTTSWERLLKTIANEYGANKHLQPGASQKEIRHLEKQLGFTLTDELSELLSIANGEQRSSNGCILFGVKLLSVEEILARHNDLLSMIEEGIISVGDEPTEKDELRKQGQTWRPGWVVFAENNDSLSLITDHVPAKGNRGQVFFRTSCQQVQDVQANSITEFLDKYESLATSTDCHPCPLDVPYL